VTSDDVLIVDRGDIDAPAVLAAKLPWKIGFVVHAEHRSPDERDQAIGVMLWNNYYEFEFDHIDKYDYAITATETEKKQLEEDFAFNGNQNPAPIFAIPVGSVSKAVLDRKHVKVADREPHSLITVSRLAPEKHVDVIGNAIPLIKEKYPDVKLHVYGVGKHKEDLDKIIEEHSLQDNIILHGHSYELDEPYENAQIYLSASTSEGFGLTYLEAISHGTTIVGLNAPYGIQEMTDQGKVGTLIDYKRSDLKSASKKMAEEVIALFDNPEQLQKYSDESYARSLNYSSESIAKKYEEWLETL
ncbi:MAG: glycosyltransferase, partial [Lactobacillaceae bacterium]|nr:glycosyltransferase [Lactobacillaceae bacterium]